MSRGSGLRWASVTLVVAGVLGAAWWLLQDAADTAPSVAAREGGAAASLVSAAGARDDRATSRGAATSAPIAALETSRQAEALTAPVITGHFGPAVPLLGRSAGLEILVTERGLPVAATLVVLGGADEGRTLATDDAGAIRTEQLYPGLALVELSTASGARCTREVLLRHRRTAKLQLDFGDHGSVSGVVRRKDGTPLGGASVALDEAFTRTDVDGRFVLPRTVSDTPVVVVRHPGFATQRQLAAGLSPDMPARPLEITLAPAATLQLVVPPVAGLAGEIDLVVVPSGGPLVLGAGRLGSSYPWSEVLPLRVPVGGEVVLDDLPSCQVEVVAFHALARGRPLSGWCRPGTPSSLEVELERAEELAVRVLRDGVPAANVLVELTVANAASDRVRDLGAHREVVDHTPVRLLPHTRQSVRSDAEGRVTLGHPGREAYVRVSDADGALRIVRRVAPGVAELSIDLARPEL